MGVYSRAKTILGVFGYASQPVILQVQVESYK